MKFEITVDDHDANDPLIGDLPWTATIYEIDEDGRSAQEPTGQGYGTTPRAALLMAELADEHAEGRWVATGGGGYEVVSVVPRVWAHLAAVVAGCPLDPATAVPETWRAVIAELADVEAPTRMTDDATAAYRPWSAGYNPDDAVDRAVMATRGAVFPWHGLDPHLP